MAASLTSTDLTLDNTSGASIPGTPSAGQTVIYPKDDKLLYYKDDAGVERLVNITGATTAITKVFTSANQTITSAGALTIAHGLGVTPTLVSGVLVNTTAQLGFSIGDIVVAPTFGTDGGVSYGIAITVDATNINIRYGSAANVFPINHKTTGGISNITNASWVYIVRVWA